MLTQQKRTLKPNVVIGIDIGGTTIKGGAVAVQPHGVVSDLVISEQMATPRLSPQPFYDVVADLARRLLARAGRMDVDMLPAVSVAHPGRFLPNGTLARGTTPNLGATPGEFDGLCPAEELERRLGIPVVAENDAVAQMRFGLHLLLRDSGVRPHLLGQTVVYLGPGTGMGGGVACVDRAGGIRVITDGHLFDLQVVGDEGQVLTAEELLTGPAIARHVSQANHRVSVPIEPATAEQVSRLLASPDARPEHRAHAQRIADLHGDLLALIIETIHAGRITKVRVEALSDGTVARHIDEPDRAWSEADKAAVRGVARCLLGGSVGTDRVLGGHLRTRALETLRRRGIHEVMIFQIPVRSADAGVLGAVQAIPLEKTPGLLNA